jgi:hypothetical protein
MTKTFQWEVTKNYNLSASEDFVIFLTFKLIKCFLLDNFTLKLKSQSIVYLLNGSEHICWILDLEDEQHSIWVIWTSGLQECKGNLIFQSWAEWAVVFGRDMNFFIIFVGVALGVRSQAPTPIHLP